MFGLASIGCITYPSTVIVKNISHNEHCCTLYSYCLMELCWNRIPLLLVMRLANVCVVVAAARVCVCRRVVCCSNMCFADYYCASVIVDINAQT